MAKRKRASTKNSPTHLRIIGGSLRGSKFLYGGDAVTRPMKERVREAVFNLLGPSVVATTTLDLFAGTGALAFEALSRGAVHATVIERHFPTVNIIRQNAKSLGVLDQLTVHAGDAFYWGPKYEPPTPAPWLVFCCPPYELYQTQLPQILELIELLVARSPADSCVIVEADQRFDFASLPEPDAWLVRAYLPAILGLYHRQVGCMSS